MQLPSSAVDRNALALAGLRIAVSCLFLIFGQYKVFGTQFTLGGGFQWWINRFLQDGVAYPFNGSGANTGRPAARHADRVPRSLRRVGDWDSASIRTFGENRERLRPCLHALLVVLFQLSWRSRPPLAVLRSLA